VRLRREGPGDALTVRDGAMLQAGFIGDVLGRLRQFFVAQRCQQIAGKDDALPAFLSQSLSGKEVGALPHGVFDFGSKSQITQALAAVDKLLV